MAILVDENTRVIVQGITGLVGGMQTKLMLEYGTKVVAGVTPRRGGAEVHGVPVYDTFKEAMAEHPEANASISFVPAPFLLDAALEAIDSGISIYVMVTDLVPFLDAVRIINFAERGGVQVIGPNTAGVTSPGKCKLGIHPVHLIKPGSVGVMSRSGGLSYEMAAELTYREIGQSTLVDIGGDPVVGMGFGELIRMYEEDRDTEVMVMLGEVGGTAEEEAAEIIRKEVSKPVVALIVGRQAPPGKRMGHAGAIVMERMGTANSKIEALRRAEVYIAKHIREVSEHCEKILRR